MNQLRWGNQTKATHHYIMVINNKTYTICGGEATSFWCQPQHAETFTSTRLSCATLCTQLTPRSGDHRVCIIMHTAHTQIRWPQGVHHYAHSSHPDQVTTGCASLCTQLTPRSGDHRVCIIMHTAHTQIRWPQGVHHYAHSSHPDQVTTGYVLYGNN